MLENLLYERLGWDPGLIVWSYRRLGLVDKIIAFEDGDRIVVLVHEQDEKEIRVDVPANTSYEDAVNTVVMYVTFGVG